MHPPGGPTTRGAVLPTSTAVAENVGKQVLAELRGPFESSRSCSSRMAIVKLRLIGKNRSRKPRSGPMLR